MIEIYMYMCIYIYNTYIYINRWIPDVMPPETYCILHPVFYDFPPLCLLFGRNILCCRPSNGSQTASPESWDSSGEDLGDHAISAMHFFMRWLLKRCPWGYTCHKSIEINICNLTTLSRATHPVPGCMAWGVGCIFQMYQQIMQP